MRGFCFALVCAFTLSSCLEANKVAPLAPGKGNEQTTSSVTLSLPRATLAELATVAQQLVIHVYKVENGILGAELRDAYKFPLTDVGTYALDGLPLGEVEFQVSLVDENNQSLAEGTLRAIINPGAQTLPKLILKPKKPTAVDVSLSVALNLVNFPDVAVEIPAEPAAVRAVLKTYRCQNCHSTQGMMAGLDLQSYPYKNKNNDAFLKILRDVVDVLTASNGLPQMPPSGAKPKAEEVTTISSHLKNVNDVLTAGGKKWIQDVRISLSLGAGRLESSLIAKDGGYALADSVSLMAGKSYTYTLTVVGPGGSKLFETVNASLAVPLDGKVQLKQDIVYQAPTVTLPVGVE